MATSELSPFLVFVCEWTLASSHNDTRCFFFPTDGGYCSCCLEGNREVCCWKTKPRACPNLGKPGEFYSHLKYSWGALCTHKSEFRLFDKAGWLQGCDKVMYKCQEINKYKIGNWRMNATCSVGRFFAQFTSSRPELWGVNNLTKFKAGWSVIQHLTYVTLL